MSRLTSPKSSPSRYAPLKLASVKSHEPTKRSSVVTVLVSESPHKRALDNESHTSANKRVTAPSSPPHATAPLTLKRTAAPPRVAVMDDEELANAIDEGNTAAAATTVATDASPSPVSQETLRRRNSSCVGCRTNHCSQKHHSAPGGCQYQGDKDDIEDSDADT